MNLGWKKGRFVGGGVEKGKKWGGDVERLCMYA